MNDELSYGMRYILEKMFSYVDAEIDDVDLRKDGWYNQYEWTPEQEDDFRNWLVDTFIHNRKVRNDVTTMNFVSKTRAEQAANWFLLYCGWKTKRKENGKHEKN